MDVTVVRMQSGWIQPRQPGKFAVEGNRALIRRYAGAVLAAINIKQKH